MQLILGLLEALSPDSAGSIWATLDDGQRDEVVMVLARLIAKAAAAAPDPAQTPGKESHDERHV